MRTAQRKRENAATTKLGRLWTKDRIHLEIAKIKLMRAAKKVLLNE